MVVLNIIASANPSCTIYMYLDQPISNANYVSLLGYSL